RRVSAVAHAHDADLPWPSVPARDGPAPGVEKIVEHLAAPFAVAGQSVRRAVTRRPSKIDLQDRVASTGQPLNDRIPLPDVARPGPAVDQQHHLRILRRGPRGQGEIARQWKPVAGLELDRV